MLWFIGAALAAPLIGEPFPEFSGLDLAGEPVAMADSYGSYTVVEAIRSVDW